MCIRPNRRLCDLIDVAIIVYLVAITVMVNGHHFFVAVIV